MLHCVFAKCASCNSSHIAAQVLDDGRYCHCPPPPKRLRGAAAVDVLVLQVILNQAVHLLLKIV